MMGAVIRCVVLPALSARHSPPQGKASDRFLDILDSHYGYCHHRGLGGSRLHKRALDGCGDLGRTVGGRSRSEERGRRLWMGRCRFSRTLLVRSHIVAAQQERKRFPRILHLSGHVRCRPDLLSWVDCAARGGACLVFDLCVWVFLVRVRCGSCRVCIVGVSDLFHSSIGDDCIRDPSEKGPPRTGTPIGSSTQYARRVSCFSQCSRGRNEWLADAWR